MITENKANLDKMKVVLALFVVLLTGYFAAETMGYRMLDVFGSQGTESTEADGSYGSQHK